MRLNGSKSTAAEKAAGLGSTKNNCVCDRVFVTMNFMSIQLKSTKTPPPSTRGRNRTVTLRTEPESKLYNNRFAQLHCGDSLSFYDSWPAPIVIISDGGYGVLGFDGDTSDHLGLPEWYEPHIRAWAAKATPQTTLWFWNSEIGWAAVHAVLENYGFRYVNANVWNKTKAHIAGNVNTGKIRRFPVVTELCVQYSFEARINGVPLKQWMLAEWE